MINFLATIRDEADRILEPWVAVVIRHRKTIRLIVAVGIVLSIVLLAYPVGRRFYGQLAWLLFLVILFLSPVAQISRSKTLGALMLFRREAGILMGILAIEHGWLFFARQGIALSFILEKEFWMTKNGLTSVGWGMAALVLTMPLLITSNNFSMRILKGNWKKLHRLAYVVLILIALHIVFVKRDFSQALVIIFVYATIKTLAVSGWKLPESQVSA